MLGVRGEEGSTTAIARCLKENTAVRNVNVNSVVQRLLAQRFSECLCLAPLIL